MRVLYDGAIYSMQAYGGISRYFAEIISRLPASYTPIVLSAKKRSFPPHPNLELHCNEFQWWPQPLKKLNRWAKRRYFNGLHNTLNADVLHPTYYSLLSTKPPQTKRFPTVLTIYDCIHERFAALIDPAGRSVDLKRKAIAKADAFICISEHTKKDLLDIYRVPEHKVTVSHLATGIGAVKAVPVPVTDSPFFLYVGSRAGYKNFDRLLAAMGNVVQRAPDAVLYVVGEPFTPAELQRINDLGLSSNVTNRGLLPDEQLKTLYQQSLALVYPSEYEGFGIPPLEAMICGTAVVAADTSSIPEVVGDAALLFPPESTDELTDILHSLLVKPSLRSGLIAKGYRQAARFHWERTVSEHQKVYCDLAQQWRQSTIRKAG